MTVHPRSKCPGPPASWGNRLALHPDFVARVRSRAQHYLEVGPTRRALVLLDMLSALDPLDPTPALVAIHRLIEAGRTGAAEVRLARIRAQHPDLPLVWVLAAQLHLAAGEAAAAVAALQQVVSADPNAETEAGQRARVVAAVARRAWDAWSGLGEAAVTG